jgi:asparagine synthase (glutamine-hydrolysing)
MLGKNASIATRDGMVLAGNGLEPYATADGKQAVIFTGSIYNAGTLRPLLKPKPKDDSIEALLLSLFKMKGNQAVHYLDGQFAFVLADGKEFYAARDPLGCKPLYFAKENGGWVFASELKAFPQSISKVSEFPPGCYFDSGSGAKRYFKIPEAPAKQVNVGEAVELIRVLITESVHKQIEPLGQVGIYLTGSLESCIIAALASEKLKRIKTFSVGLSGSDDGNTAKRVASWLSTDHTHYEITQQELLDCIQDVVYAVESFDAGVIRHAVAAYYAAKMARGKIEYMVGGAGANEIFGGYAYLRPMFSEKLTQEIRTISEDMHKTSLLRWDRICALHGIGARSPYTDRKLVTAAFHLPANLKINEEGRSKWILRRAFSTQLPAWVVDRPDQDDTISAGIQTALQEYAETVFTDDDLAKEAGAANIRTKDELLYYQIWSSKFPAHFVPLVGRTQIL